MLSSTRPNTTASPDVKQAAAPRFSFRHVVAFAARVV
jgi:hypothetical protein